MFIRFWLIVMVIQITSSLRTDDSKQNSAENQQFTLSQKSHKLSQWKKPEQIQHKQNLVNYSIEDINGTNWMSFLDDQLLSSQISVPGSHDSAAYSAQQWYSIILSPFWKTQQIDIQSQLRIGTRFLDLRVKCQTDEGLTLFHGAIYLGGITKALQPIYDFLQENPGQFLFVMFQKQQGDDDPSTCGDKIQIDLAGKVGKIPRYCYECNLGEIPKIKQLRGKIWLLISDPQDNNSIALTGQYQIPTYNKYQIQKTILSYSQNFWDGPQSTKKNSIIQVINAPKNFLRINFLTQAYFPSTYAEVYNTWFKQYFKQNNLTKVGIIIFDYIDEQLAKLVYLSNF